MKKKQMEAVLQLERKKKKKGGGGGKQAKDEKVTSNGESTTATSLATPAISKTTTTNPMRDRLVAKTTPPGSKIGALLSPSDKIHAKRLQVLRMSEGKREEKEEKRREGEDTETKENESAPNHGSTPKLKKKQAEKEPVPTPDVAALTTPSKTSKKKKKNREQRELQLQQAATGEQPMQQMRTKSKLHGNGVAKGEREAEEGRAERQRVKVERRLQKKRAVVIERRPSESDPTVPNEDTVPSGPHSKNGTVPKQHHAHPTAHHYKNGTAHNSQPPHTPRPTVTYPMANGTRNGVARATPQHIRFASESPEKKPSPTVAKSIDNGRSTDEEEEEKERVTKMNGRVKKYSSPEVSTTSSESSDGGHQKEEIRKKKLTKNPEVVSSSSALKKGLAESKTTTSNENLEVTSSSKKDSKSTVTPTPSKTVVKNQKKEQNRGQKIESDSDSADSPVVKNQKPKAPEVTTMTSSEEKKEGKKAKKEKKKKSRQEAGKEAAGIESGQPEPEREEERLRPSSDLLQMVAEKLANNHGLLVFRMISRETRRIADQQLRTAADAVLHLEEFDDENAFTRDDMAAWWEARREAEDTTVGEGKENLSHQQISAYLRMRSVEKKLLRDMDGGLSHPSDAARAVDPTELLQHPLETLDAACLLHESQGAAAARLLQQEGRALREVWLGNSSAKLARELKRIPAVERFEHRQATMATLERLPLLQMTELRVDIVDEGATRAGLADHLVNGRNLIALELNVVPCGPLDGNTASQYTLFTRRSYDRADYTDDLEWMIPNVEEGEPDPVTLCLPALEHLSTNVANVKIFWQLRDTSLLLRQLRSLRIGTLSTTKELIASAELFADTKESRRYKQPGFFSLRDAYETQLESVTLRLADRVGVARLQRDAATLFEAIGELPPSLRRFSTSLFYNQFGGVCAPFRKWAEPEAAGDVPDTEHMRIEEAHLHFERAFDLRGLPALLPRTIKTLSIAVNYENEDDARCLGPFLEMLPGLERLECLEDLRIQVWGVRCLQPLVSAISSCGALAARLTRLAVAAYPVDDQFFEGTAAAVWLRSSLSAFPRLRSIGLHAAVLVRMIPEERRSGYSWRNGLAWLANEWLGGGEQSEKAFEKIELAAAGALPVLDCGEEYTITPHWEVEYDSAALVLAPEDEEEHEEMDDSSFATIPHGSSDEDDDFITDDDEEEQAGDASRDDLDRMEEGLEDETERIERRARRREEKERAAMERGEVVGEGEEEEGEVMDFDAISDAEEEETQPRSEFFDDEAVESDREESEEEEGEQKQEESAESECSSEDDDEQREKEREEEEGRRQKRKERKQAKLEESAEAKRKRKRVLESDEDEEDEILISRAPRNKKKKVIIESDDE